MPDAALIQLVLTGGGLAVAMLVLVWIVGGKLHSDSETKGLRDDKESLFKVNGEQSTALKESNQLLSKALDTYQEMRRENAELIRDNAELRGRLAR